MCGISGQLRLDGHPVDRGLVRRMTRRLAHRGPDGERFYFSGHVGLGHRRLAIIDLAGGAQPMIDADRQLALAANNEIYNYKELRRGLESRGCRFRTASDTEVILQMIALDGVAGLRALEGMFAFAMWNGLTETLLLARDRFGVKPLYYLQDGSSFLFASELAALLEYPRLDLALDPAAIDGYFGSLAVPEPRSVFAGVQKLSAGHYLTVSRGRVAVKPFWQMPGANPVRVLTTRAASEALVHELERSVAITLRSDVPVGVLLSGGLDSSSVAAIAHRATGRSYPAFSAVFREQDFDEGPFARSVANRLGCRHQTVLVTKARATRIAEDLARTIDEPFADSSAIPTSAVCELAAAHVKTVLSGEGADELFAGYHWHTRTRPASSEHPARAVFLAHERELLYSPAWREVMERSRAHESPRASRSRARSDLQRALHADLAGYLPSDILFKSDRMSMRHSLELRVPFLNHRLAEFAMRLPDRFKLHGGIRKYLLRKVMQAELPAGVLRRPKKGFSIPMDLWLWERGSWRDLVYDTVFSRRTRQRGQLNFATLEKLRQEHDRLERLHGYKLWTVFMFEMWQRSFLDRSASSGRTRR